MGQFVDYRNKKYKEGKDLLTERSQFIHKLMDQQNVSEEEMEKRTIELGLLRKAFIARIADSFFRICAIGLFIGGFFYYPLWQFSLGFLVLAFLNFVRCEILKISIRKLIHEDTN